MTALACPRAGRCEAAGSYADDRGDTPALLLSQGPGGWRAARAPVPGGSRSPGFADIEALSCTSVGTCIAVGDYSDSPGTSSEGADTQALIEVLRNGRWSAIRAPLPRNADHQPEADLGAIACPRRGSCIAVGSYLSDGNDRPLVSRQTASGWVAQHVRLPKDTFQDDDAFLNDVACWKPQHCVAVGAYPGRTGQDGLVLRVSPHHWRTREINRGRLSTDLDLVRCPRRKRCTAVGTAWNGSLNRPTRGLATSLVANGAWKTSLTPVPKAAHIKTVTDLSFDDLSCTAPGSCTAVGSYYNDVPAGDGFDVPLVVDERSGRWVAPALPIQTRLGAQGDLYAISCGGRGACVAVGDFQLGGRPAQALVLTNSGGTWRQLRAPLIRGAGSQSLSSVVCHSVHYCLALGTFMDTAGSTWPLLLSRAGSTWEPQHLPLPVGAGTTQDVVLGNVSCSQPQACVALGSNSNHSVIAETRAGGRWLPSVLPLPRNISPVPAVSIGSLQCPMPGYCVAGGAYSDTEGDQLALLLTETHGKWRPVVPRLPAGAALRGQDAVITGLSCTERASCTASGNYVDSNGNPRGMILTTSGGSWRAIVAPVPKTANKRPWDYATDASCEPTGYCVVVGYYRAGKNIAALVDAEATGGHWKTVALALPRDAIGKFRHFVALTRVACTLGACVAVGGYVDKSIRFDGLIASNQGDEWTSVNAPLPQKSDQPIGFFIGGLSDVACQSAKLCTAVGGYDTSQASIGPWILSGHGRSWHVVQGLPTSPENSYAFGFLTVACTAESCQALGELPGPHGDTLPVVASGSGLRWLMSWLPLPPNALPSQGSQDAYLPDVSCPAAASCVAVGAYLDSGLAFQPLIETQRK